MVICQSGPKVDVETTMCERPYNVVQLVCIVWAPEAFFRTIARLVKALRRRVI